MATKLRKDVARECGTERERYIVKLKAGGQYPDTVEVREKGGRKRYEVTVGALFIYAVRRAVDAMPKKKRAVKRGLLTLGREMR
jgi:hypothetical protein